MPRADRGMPRVVPAALAVLFALASPALAGKGRVTGSVGAGFDSYRERYSIVDADTVDSLNEFRSRLSLGYLHGSPYEDFVAIEGLTLIGEDSREYTGSLDFLRRFGPRGSRVGIDADVTRRDYRDDSSYEFANDHTRYYLRSYARWWTGPLVIRAGDRLEHIDYENRTEFDYDYTRNTVTLDTGLDLDLTGYAGFSLGFTTMDIPDSTGIAYHAWVPGVELRIASGPHRRLFAYIVSERRVYPGDSPRSSFWSVLSSASGELPLAGTFSMEAKNDVEYYTYDAPNDAYFDYTETRSTILLKYNRSWEFHLGVGPAFGFFASDDSPDDEYHEVGGRAEVEYWHGQRVWASASYELGHRTYPSYNEAATDEMAVYSDYNYHRVSAIMNAHIHDGLSAALLVDYQPEDHEREGDDSTVTLFSASITYSF